MSRPRILLVDDDESLTRSLKRYLEKTGRFEVRTESRGGEAKGAVREFEPDLILLDIVMPDVNGTEVAASLREDPELREIPVVFLTGLVSPEEVGGGSRQIGGHPFIPKPVEPEELVREIERYLESPVEHERRRVGPKRLVEIFNLNLWRHEACALCEFWGAPERVEEPGSGPNWAPPKLRVEDGEVSGECREVADRVLWEARAQYDVEWDDWEASEGVE